MDLCRIAVNPNAFKEGQDRCPEYHNVYIEPGSYETYKKTNEFPEGTILFKELQLILPGENQDESRTEPSGQGSVRGEFNAADVTVQDPKRFANTGGWNTSISIIPRLRHRSP